MKRNIQLILEYDGTNYHGWQEQKGIKTVQGCLKASIRKLTGENIPVYGASRTDAGVHAWAQVANFHTQSAIPTDAFAKALNTYLPSDIVVKKSCEVDPNFHAQFSAIAKAYNYRIVYRPTRPALEQNYVHWIWFSVDIEKMRRAAQYLVGTHDFSSFAAANSPRKTNVRTVNYIDIQKNSWYINFCIEANGFLYKMVRNIVGTLLLVGRNSITEDEFQKIILAKDRALAGPTAPAKGLFLKYVRYKEITLNSWETL